MNLVPISEIFDIEYGNQLDLNKLDQVSQGVAFVSRSSQNNGYRCDVSEISETTPYGSGLITVTMGGTYLLSAFVQPRPFYTAQNIKVLTPKIEMSLEVRLAYCAAISANRFRYVSHGREANSTFDGLLVPQTDYLHKEISEINVCGPSIQPSSSSNLSLKDRDWQLFKYDQLFHIERGRGPRKKDITFGNVPFVTSTDSNNGVSQFISDVPVHQGNVIGVNRNGSIGLAFYQPEAFCSTEDVHIFTAKFKMNIYIAMYICTIIKKEAYRFSYGRKWGIERMKDSVMILPADSKGEPD